MSNSFDAIELLLLIIIISIVVYFITKWCTGGQTDKMAAVAVASALLVSDETTTDTVDPDNTVDSSLSITGGSAEPITGSKQTTYDEYDDKLLLQEAEPEFIERINNVIIDGNNFIHRLYNDLGHKGTPGTAEYYEYIKIATDLLYSILPGKNLFFVFKDPESDSQKKKTLEFFKAKTIKTAYKQFFGQLAKDHPGVRYIIAFGDSKYRDDYAAIWLAGTLDRDTILLSRDRYRDVSDMSSEKITFSVYGEHANKISKLIDKPFISADIGTVRSTLVGYTFSKQRVTGFYSKKVNRKSVASDHVLVIKLAKPVKVENKSVDLQSAESKHTVKVENKLVESKPTVKVENKSVENKSVEEKLVESKSIPKPVPPKPTLPPIKKETIDNWLLPSKSDSKPKMGLAF